MTETQFHFSVAQYLDLVLTPATNWTTVGHGGGGKVRGAKLKGMGVKPGVPDVLLITGGQYFGIELKTEKGRLSPAQRAAHEAIEKAGGHVAVCRNITEIEDRLREWGISMR
jgi:hypothetical protein